MFNTVKGYVEKALTDPYAFGGAVFDIGSCFVGVGEVTAAVKVLAAFGKLAEGAKVFQVAEKSGKIVGKLEEVAAFMNKLPGSMKNVVEKIKNIEIPDLSPKPSFAGVGNVGERHLESYFRLLIILEQGYREMMVTGKVSQVMGNGILIKLKLKV
ncbi:hypothetical protein [Bacillus nitratireducens]|uniref:hypothetical protein n=1 Tax=Bacillus nitratireducens TaxID=2026193 RepID=UPI003466CACA